jgi:hypothetical protein
LCFLRPATHAERIPYTLANFSRLAFRRLVVDGSIFFQMPQEMIDKALQHAVNVGVPCASVSAPLVFRSDMPDATWEKCLSQAESLRLTQYRTMLLADFDRVSDKVCVVQCSQNSDFMSGVSSLIPTLLREALLWRIVPVWHGDEVAYHAEYDRPMMAEEHLAAQGVAVPCLLPEAHPLARDSPLSAIFERDLCTPTELRSFAGNSMHLCAVGNVFLFFLCSFRLVD